MTVTSLRTVIGAGAVVGMFVVCGAGVAARQARSVWDGVYTAEQALRGAPLYQQSCAECHGPDMSGGCLLYTSDAADE